MDFYIVMLPTLIGSLYMISHLHKLKKHDKVLYKFCQVRREMMSMFRESGFKLSGTDYIIARQLAEITNVTIHDFDNNKSTLFNFRKFVDQVKTIKALGKKIDGRKYANPDIAKLYDSYSKALLLAFVTFTPFIKSELFLRISSVLIKLLAKVGGRYFKRSAGRLVELTTWVRAEAYEGGYR